MTPTQHMTLYHQAALSLSITLLHNFRDVPYYIINLAPISTRNFISVKPHH